MAGPLPVRRPRRRRHPIVAIPAAIGLLGAVLLITGSLQVIKANVVTGIPVAMPNTHLAASGQPNGHRLTTTPESTSAPDIASSTTPVTAPSASSRPVSPAILPANTIRLPQGDLAFLVHEQVAANGELPIPAGVRQATWWGVAFDATAGATVFAGHVNWAGVVGPFAELWHDGIGGNISVADGTGKTWLFRVNQVITVYKDQLPAQAPTLFGAGGPRRIVVVTCGGEWVGGQEGYNENRVLVAVPV